MASFAVSLHLVWIMVSPASYLERATTAHDTLERHRCALFPRCSYEWVQETYSTQPPLLSIKTSCTSGFEVCSAWEDYSPPYDMVSNEGVKATHDG